MEAVQLSCPAANHRKSHPSQADCEGEQSGCLAGSSLGKCNGHLSVWQGVHPVMNAGPRLGQGWV